VASNAEIGGLKGMSARKVIIIGSGPAGYTAAVYAARANLAPLLFTGVQAGGQLMLTTLVENYPGFVEGLMGPDLMDVFRKQAERFGTEMIGDDVTAVDFSRRPLVVKVGDTEYQGHTVVIATGATAKLLGLPAEMALMGRGVSTCATCDGFFFKGVNLVVVGGGDSAMEESTYLSKYASRVYIVHRRDKFRASRIMAERALENSKIEVKWNSVIDEVLGTETEGVTGVRIRSTVEPDEAQDLEASGYFAAIGHTPNTDFLEGQLETDEKGYVKWTTPFRTDTTVEGVFAAGDVADSYYRQAVTAAGTGCMAALDAERWLVAKGVE
ncbi:MAG: thioredoxin-disulfide reductase, partial [Candidatus Limnocylindria bacterium]